MCVRVSLSVCVCPCLCVCVCALMSYLSVIQIRLYKRALEAGLHVANVVTVLERENKYTVELNINQ